MNLSRRSKLSLCQFLDLFTKDGVSLLLEKHGLCDVDLEWSKSDGIGEAIRRASGEEIRRILDEVLRTRQTLRSEVSPRYRFDERWKDLLLCLELDGYRRGLDEDERETDSFVPNEPTIDGVQAVEDDLTLEIGRSGIPEADEIVQVIEKSADAFQREDFNACLSSSRVALESLARSIAQKMQGNQPREFDPRKWGAIVTYLRKSGFIACREEAALVGVYGFISRASHAPIGFSEKEFARLGRSLALGLCYFLIKQFNAQHHPHQ